jgi:predicted PurR-regulated permease PerM
MEGEEGKITCVKGDGTTSAIPEKDYNSTQSRITTTLASVLAGLILLLGIVIYIPFIEPIAWAIILALFFYPVYIKLSRICFGYDAIASLCMCILITAFIVIPVFVLLGSLMSEVLKVYSEVMNYVQSGHFSVIPDKTRFPVIHTAVVSIMDTLRIDEQSISDTIVGMSKNMGDFFLKQGTMVFKNIAVIVFKSALMLVTLFYLFTDGRKMLDAFKELLPMNDVASHNFMQLTADVLSATLYGNVLTAAIQAGVGFGILWALGFSAPLLWGLILGLGTFIPMVGTAIVWLPATIYLFFTGLYIKGFILLLFSSDFGDSHGSPKSVQNRSNIKGLR